jgi:hypothetical protein
MFGAALHAARMAFSVSGGNIIFGGGHDAVTGVPSAPRVPGVISRLELDKVVRSFVPSPGHGRFRQTLVSRHLVILRAAAGWGRTAAAEYLLHDALTTSPPPDDWPDDEVGAVRISRLDAETDLRAFTVEHLRSAGDEEPVRGFLLDVAVPPGAGLLRGSDLERLAGQLAKAHSYLVVTVDAGTVFGDELAEFLHDGEAPPAALDVVARHAARVLARPAADVLHLARDNAELGQLVEGLAREGPNCDGLAQLGERWARAGAGAPDDDLRRWVAASLDARFVAWLAEPGLTTDHRALVVALAVFHGMSYAKVARLAHDLEGRVLAAAREHAPTILRASPARDGDGSRPGDDGVPRWRMFTRPRGARLAAARAEVRAGSESTPYGEVGTELVSFTDDSYPWKILHWVWHEQNGLHGVLLEWLSALGGDNDPAVRVRAAAAVGVLGGWAFDKIRIRVLLPWADEDHSWLREAVAAALSLSVTRRPDLLPVVTSMLRDWKLHTRHPARRRAAVRAWGAGLGPWNPSRALAEMNYLTMPLFDADERDEDQDGVDYDLAVEVARSVYNVFFSAPPADANDSDDVGDVRLADQTDAAASTAEWDNAAGGAGVACPAAGRDRSADAVLAVLRWLTRWTRDRDGPTRRFAGVVSFLWLTSEGRAPGPARWNGRPALLALCMRGQRQTVLGGDLTVALPAGGDRDAREQVSLLWRRALDEPRLSDLARDCLRQWVASAEEEGDRDRETLADIMLLSLHTKANFDRAWRDFSRWEKRWPATCGTVLRSIRQSVS